MIKNIVSPLDPTRKIGSIIPEKCKVMDSAKAPLWLVFNSEDGRGGTYYLLFKSGDDLRQDVLTLQMLQIMDQLWKSEGLDLQLTKYGCISTGVDQGFIEVVLNSDTVSNIQKAHSGITAPFRETPLADWLKELNVTEKQFESAVHNFTISCAGYCVATYVLGIGDRHNDNIMVNQDGHLFHIDYGHFLGNFKTFAGFKREKAPFVFTPDFAYVIGGRDSPNFQYFMEVCCKAYNILRKNANIFINLFAMMLSTGIPELKSSKDLIPLRDAFGLELTEEEATERMKRLIIESLNTKTTQLNFAIHIIAHYKT